LPVSLATLTHEPSQFVVPDAHDVVQAPAAQTWFCPQALPHLPQFARSLWRPTQAPLH
jgi:hypothetical protein